MTIHARLFSVTGDKRRTVLATGQGTGAVSWLDFAFRLMYLPIGLFGVSVATVSTAASYSAIRSPSVSVGDSPVVPVTTRPSEPFSSRCSHRERNAPRSTEPSSRNGVTIAVSTSPSTTKV